MCFTCNASLAKRFPYRNLLNFSELLEEGYTPFYLSLVATCSLGKKIFKNG